MNIFNLIGWIGAIMVVGAYYLISRKVIDSSNNYFQLLNLFGAVGVGVNALYLQAWPSLAIQVVWATISLFTLSRARKTID